MPYINLTRDQILAIILHATLFYTIQCFHSKLTFELYQVNVIYATAVYDNVVKDLY